MVCLVSLFAEAALYVWVSFAVAAESCAGFMGRVVVCVPFNSFIPLTYAVNIVAIGDIVVVQGLQLLSCHMVSFVSAPLTVLFGGAWLYLVLSVIGTIE